MMSITSRLPQPALLIAGLIVVLATLLIVQYVSMNAANTPYMDEWLDSAEIAIRTAEGRLTAADFFLQNNEHRQLFTNIVSALLVPLTRWDVRVQMALTVLAALISVALIIDLLRQQMRGGLLAIGMAACAVLILSLRQRDIWLWSYLLAWTQGIACLIFGIWALSRLPVGWGGVGGAIFGAFGVLFSLIYGIAAWGLFPLLMWLRGYRKPAHYLVFIAAGILIVGLFFTNYDFSVMGANRDGQSAGLVRDPFRIGLFMLAVLGNPLTPLRTDAYLIAIATGALGIALLAANLALVWQRRDHLLRDAAPWIILVLFGLACAGVIALGRAHEFPEPFPSIPIQSRYTPPPSLAWVGLIGLGLLTARALLKDRAAGTLHRAGRALLTVNIIALAAGTGVFIFTLRHMGTITPLVDEDSRQCVLDFPATRNFLCMTDIYLFDTDPTLISGRMSDLARLGLSAYAGQTPVYDEVIPLYTVTRRDLRLTNADVGYGMRVMGGRYAAISFVQPAPAATEFDIQMPDRPGRIVFASALWIDVEDAGAAGVPADGVTFSASVRTAATPDTVLFSETIAMMSNPIPLLLDISELRGQAITLTLRTDITRDQPMTQALTWLDPRIEVRPEETAP